MKTPIKRAVAVTLLLVLLISGLPWSGIVPAATAETEPVEAAEAPEPIPASETAVSDAPTDPPVEVEEAAPTEAVIALQPAEASDELQPAEAVEPLALNPSQDARILASGNGGYLYRSGTVGSGYYIFPSASASPTTFSWQYANGAGKSTVFGEDSPSILHYMNDVKTAPTTVFEAPVAYCLEPELGTVNEQLYEGLSPAQSTIWNSLLSPAQQSAIQVAGTYGWPNGFSDRPNGDMNKDGDTAFQYQFATQIIIWEIVMGLRSSTGQYALTNNSLKNIYYSAPQYGSHADFRAAYDEIDARIARHNSYPSFAAASASAAPVHRMDYNSSTGRYTLTLTDSNQILGQDYNQFAAPSGVTISQNGNTLTITATAAALSSGAVLISGTGKKLAVAPSTQKVWQYIKDDGSHRQTLMTIGNGGQAAAYFKLEAETKTVSLKKTSNASASVQACIQDNDLYTLSGATYEIRKDSPTGQLMETLVTDKYGNATGTVKYNVGTVLYAVETKAPSGYKLNSTPVRLTVSSSGNNVFNVSDTPTFDPRAMRIKKTGANSEYIQGAVFKADFYAWTWMNPDTLLRTWYLQSDANGVVKFDDTHLLSSYEGNTSDPLFKPDGQVQFPLGCVYIREIQAANGYITPVGNDAGVLIFIDPDSNGEAVAYWGDAAGKPITTQNPKGIYKMENDAQNQTITAVNESSSGTMTMQKSLPTGYTGSVEGYRFLLSRNEDGSAWYGKSDADGKVYKTNSSFVESDASKRVYTFDGLKDGTYTFREKLDGVNAKPTKVRFITSGGITPSVEHTYTGSDITFSDGDCVIGGIVLTGLNGGGNLTIEIENTPFVYGEPFELVKIGPSDVKLSGAIFKVDYFNDGWFNQDELKKTWYFTTDSNGYFTLDADHLLNNEEYQSATLFEAGKIPLGIMRVTEVKAPEGFKPVQMIGAWRMMQSGTDRSKAECYWAAADGYTPTTSYGDEAYTLDADPTRLYVKDTPIYGNIELTKVDKDYPDHKLTGAEFTVTMTKGGNSETAVMTEVLDENGKGIGVYVLEHIEYGTVCEIQETKAPEGYVLSDEVFTVTINEEKTYKVGNGAYDCVTNKQIEGSIVMHKVDAEGQTLQGVKFLLEYSVDEGASWSPVLYRNADAPTQIGGCISEGLENGILTTDEDGCVAYTGLAVNTQYGKVVYRVTELETLPGYEMLTDAIYVGELAGDKVDLAFTVVNHKSFDMPMTGSKGFTASGIGLGLCVLAALFILFNLPQKRKNDKN